MGYGNPQAALTQGLNLDDVTRFAEEVVRIGTLASTGFPVLTANQRKRVARAKRSVLAVLNDITRLCDEQGVDAESVARLRALAAYLELVNKLVADVDSLKLILDDVELQVGSAIWLEARGLHVQLKGKAKANSSLEIPLEPIKKAFTIPPRGGKKRGEPSGQGGT